MHAWVVELARHAGLRGRWGESSVRVQLPPHALRSLTGALGSVRRAVNALSLTAWFESTGLHCWSRRLHAGRGSPRRGKCSGAAASNLAPYPNFRQRTPAQNRCVVGSTPTGATTPLYPNWQRVRLQNPVSLGSTPRGGTLSCLDTRCRQEGLVRESSESVDGTAGT